MLSLASYVVVVVDNIVVNFHVGGCSCVGGLRICGVVVYANRYVVVCAGSVVVFVVELFVILLCVLSSLLVLYIFVVVQLVILVLMLFCWCYTR